MSEENTFKISYVEGRKNNMFSNVYNTRNTLVHEGRHLEQYSILEHSFGRGAPFSLNMSSNIFREGLEYNAVEHQKNHLTWGKTTPSYKTNALKYQTNHPSGNAAWRNAIGEVRLKSKK